MKLIIIQLTVFSVVWMQYFVFAKSKVKLDLLYEDGVDPAILKKQFYHPLLEGRTCRMIEPQPQREYGFEGEIQNSRLRSYFHSYLTKSEGLSPYYLQKGICCDKPLKKKFKKNKYGEYSFHYESSQYLRRAETGGFEKTESGGIDFVVRGIFYLLHKLWIYTSSANGFSIYPYPNATINKQRSFYVKHDQIPSAVDVYLCSCCMQHGTCLKQCDTKAAPAKECAAPVAPNEKLPEIEEQWVKYYGNYAYELKIKFKNAFYERAEYFGMIDSDGIGNIFGYFPHPDHQGKYLQYFYQGSEQQMYIKPKYFPNMYDCGSIPPPAAPSPGYKPAFTEVEINPNVLRTCVG